MVRVVHIRQIRRRLKDRNLNKNSGSGRGGRNYLIAKLITLFFALAVATARQPGDLILGLEFWKATLSLEAR